MKMSYSDKKENIKVDLKYAFKLRTVLANTQEGKLPLHSLIVTNANKRGVWG